MLVKEKKRESGIENRVSRIEIMFTIDLLNGQGIPIKSRPESIAIAVVTAVVPIIIAMVMFGFYLSNNIVTATQKQEIVKYETMINKLSDAIKIQKSLEKEKDAISSCLTEVSTSLGRHAQWSPILMTLVENMPDSVILTKLEVKQRSITRKVPRKDDPQKTTNISVPIRTLHVSVCGSPQSACDKEVKDFRDRLRLSSLLGSKLEDIKVSQRFDTFGGQDVVFYEMDCVFKPGF